MIMVLADYYRSEYSTCCSNSLNFNATFSICFLKPYSMYLSQSSLFKTFSILFARYFYIIKPELRTSSVKCKNITFQTLIKFWKYAQTSIKYLLLLKNMSKLSPLPPKNFQKNVYSPLGKEESNSKIDKAGITKFTLKNNHSKYLFDKPDLNSGRQTERKTYQYMQSHSVQALIERVRALGNQNAELYRLLEERGRIIVALQKKLQNPAEKEVKLRQTHTLMQQQTQLKMIQYEETIYSLKRELQEVKSKTIQQNVALLRQFDPNTQSKDKDTLQLLKNIQIQKICRNANQEETKVLKDIVNIKNIQMTELSNSFLNINQKLKCELSKIQNQLIEVHNRSRSDLTEQQMTFQHKIQSCTRQHIHELQVLGMQHSLQLKKLENIIDKKNSELQKMKQQKINDKKQIENRYDELIDNNNKLQKQIQEIEKNYKQYLKDQMYKMEDTHLNEVKSLISSNEARVNDLEAEVQKQEAIIESKTEEIDRLQREIHQFKVHSSSKDAHYEKVVKELKEEQVRLHLSQNEQQKRTKLTYQQLKEADISAIKLFYEHQIELLNSYLHEQMQLYDKTKTSLFLQIDEKEEMRKTYDMQISNLNLRIKQLEAQNKEITSNKREQIEALNNKIQQNQTFSKQSAKIKSDSASNHDEDIKNLQRLINNKDNEIEELNKKIILIKENTSQEIEQKQSSLAFMKKAKEEVESFSKKQKFLFENELKKKEMALKANKDIYDADIQLMKMTHKREYDVLMKELEQVKGQMNSEITTLRNNEKHLKNELQNIKTAKKVEQDSSKSDLIAENRRFSEEKSKLESQLTLCFTAETSKLKRQIEQLKKKMIYKDQDLRNTNDKYHRLQQKMAMVLQSQQKLKNIENKMISFGSENNLVKNMTEMMKNRQN